MLHFARIFSGFFEHFQNFHENVKSHLERAVNRQPGNRTNDAESSHAHQRLPESNSTAHEMHMNIFKIKFPLFFFQSFSKFSKKFKILVSGKNPVLVNNFLQTYRFETTDAVLDRS